MDPRRGEMGTRGPVYCIFTSPDPNGVKRLLTVRA